jgi:hypothetical protein
MTPVWRRITKKLKLAYGEEIEKLDCGTAGCYCGHTINQAKPSLFHKHFSSFEIAAKLLDIPTQEADYLFTFHHTTGPVEWYNPYGDLGEKLNTHKPGTLAYAKVVVQAANRCMRRNRYKHYDGPVLDATVAERAA